MYKYVIRQSRQHLRVLDQTSTGPDVKVVTLVPIDAEATISNIRLYQRPDLQGLSPGNARVGRPRPTKHNIMLVIEEVGYVYVSRRSA